MIRSSWTYLIFFLSLKQLWSDTLDAYPYVFSFSDYFNLFQFQTVTVLKDYNSVMMLQNSPLKVNITDKIPKFI